MNNILCFGEILWDAFGDEKVAGGAPMNVARHLAQQGANVSFASRVGSDESGNGLIDFLRSGGLYSDLIQMDDKLPTCEVTVQLDKDGHATYVFPPVVSWDNIQPAPQLTETAKRATAIIYGILACRQTTTKETLVNLLKETSALKVFDVNLRPPHYTMETLETLMKTADVIKMNDDEADLLSASGNTLEEKILLLHNTNKAKTICVTRGAHGAIVWHNNEFVEHPGFKVNVVDTVGAGDSFLATFINGLLNRLPMPEILERACKVGAFVAGKRGANPIYEPGLLN
jgi:fructokinase